jgi:hypothetical protein
VTLAAPNIHSLGIDFGSIDGDTNIDFVAAKEAGATFVAMKRCQHLTHDSAAGLADKARAAGLVVMLYDFPGYGPHAATASQQADAFDSGPGDVIPGIDFPPAIDVERSAAWATTGWTEAQCAAFVDDMVKAFEDKYGCRPIVYTGFFQWDALKRPPLPRASRCGLWIKTAYPVAARHPVYQAVPHDPHAGDTSADDHKSYYAIPKPWGDQWILHQIQGDATGFPGFRRTVDINRYHTARKGDRGGHIRLYQEALATLPDPLRGPLNASGVYDDDTASAVRAVQAKYGLAVDEIIGPKTGARILWSSK